MPVPSLSDLSKQHLDADNFARLMDDTLAASTPRGKVKATLDPKTAQNRFQDLARQLQGDALIHKDNEELKILSDLSADFTSGKPFGASLGKFRRKFDNWKKQKDNWFREAQEKSQLKEEIEGTFANVSKEADRSQKLLKDETSKLRGVAGQDELNRFEATGAGLRGAIAGHTKKIDSIRTQLQEKNLTRDELQNLKKELAQEITKAKETRTKFTNDSAAFYQKTVSKKEIKKEEKAETEEEKEEAPKKEVEEKPEIKAEEAEAEEKAVAEEAKPTTVKEAAAAVKPPEPPEELKKLGQKAAALMLTKEALAAENPEELLANKNKEVMNLIAEIDGLPDDVFMLDSTDRLKNEVTKYAKFIQQSSNKVPKVLPSGERILVTPPLDISGYTDATIGLQPVFAELGVTVTVPNQSATQVSGQVSVTAQVTPPSVTAETKVTVEGKIGRAAAARNIPITAEVTATAVIGAAVASGAAQAVQWFESHQNLTTEQIVTQARQDIQTRTARETEASFIGRGELAQAKAENVGFSRGISRQMATKGQQTNDQKLTGAASDISKFAEQTARQAPVALETPGAKAAAPGVFWQPEELEAIDQEWDNIATRAPAAPPMAIGAAPLPTAPTTAGGGGTTPEKISTAGVAGQPRVPRPTPRVAAPTPKAERLPPGVSLAKEPLRLPPSQPGSRRAPGTTAEGVGGDTQMSDQSIGFGDEQARPSVLDQGVPSSRGSYAQGETVEPPMAGEGEALETFGGGEFGVDNKAAQLESERAKEKMRVAESLIPGAGAAAGTVASQAQVGAEQPGEEAEETGADLAAGGEGKQGESTLDRGKQMIEDKLKEKLEKEVKKEVERMAKKALQKVTQQSASAGARVTTEVAEGASSEFVVPFIILIVQMNVQLFLKYILKAGKGLGVDAEELSEQQMGEEAGKATGIAQSFLEQSFIEDIITLFIDCNLICCNPATFPILVILLVLFFIIFGVVAGTDSDVQKMLGFG